MDTTEPNPSILWQNVVGAFVFACLAVYFHRQQPANEPAAMLALTTAAALFRHSGRRRKPQPPMSMGSPSLPVLCLAFLALGACDKGAGGPLDICMAGHISRPAPAAVRASLGTLQVPGDLEAMGGIAADYVSIKPQASAPTELTGRAGIYANSSDNLLRFVDTSGNARIMGEASRLRSSAGTPADVALTWIWYDSGADSVVARLSGGNVTLAGAGGNVTIDTVQTITGAKTFSAAAVFNGAVTLGDAIADIIGIKGALRIYNTAGTFYSEITPGATANRAVTLPDAAGAIVLDGATQSLSAKTLVSPVISTGLTATGAAANTFAGSTGTFITSTGANTLSGDVSIAAGKDVVYAAGDGIFDGSLGTGIFKTTTGACTIGGGAAAIGITSSGAAITITGGATSVWSLSAGDLRVDAAGALNLGTTAATSTTVGRSGQVTNALGTVQINSTPTAATFYKTCTISSASASVAVNCLAAADVPAALSAKVAKWHAKVNGATPWATTATCTLEDTAGNDLVVIPVAALLANAFVNDNTAGMTLADRYALGTGGAVDTGLQIICDANGTGSDLVFVVSGTVQ